MAELRYLDPTDLDEAVSAFGTFYAGGTTLVDLMKLGVVEPEVLIDVNRLGLDSIEETGEGFRIGAGVRNSALAAHPALAEQFPALRRAILAGASGQIRNMASLAGNLLQRTRCSYFRDVHSECNKRQPGSGCAARQGVHDGHALFGTSPACMAVFPSDMATALALAEPVIITQRRAIPWNEFYCLPQATPERETVLEPGELITHLDLPIQPTLRRSAYLKLRDRSSYEFALVSVAAALTVGDGIVSDVRIAVGGVATTPWRCRNAEEYLHGKPASREHFNQAASIALEAAEPTPQTRFKLELLRRSLVHTLVGLKS